MAIPATSATSSATADARGLSMTHAGGAARDAYEHALTDFHGYYGNPLATIDGALEAAPDFVMGHALRAGMLLTSSEKAALPLAATSVQRMEALASGANDRERRHARAARGLAEEFFDSGKVLARLLRAVEAAA